MRDLGFAEGLVTGLLNTGLAAHLCVDNAAARERFCEALARARVLHDRPNVAYALLGLALAAASDDPERAATLLGSADTLFEQLGRLPDAVEIRARDASQMQLRDTLGETFETWYRRGRELALDDAVTLAQPRT